MSDLPTGAATGAATGPTTLSAPLATGPATLPVPLATGPTTLPAPLVTGPTTLPAPLTTGPATLPAPLVTGPTTLPAPLATGPTYITISGPLDDEYGPEFPDIIDPNIEPATFNDGFILYNESTLEAMSLPDLVNYSTAISTSIGLEYSTINANQDAINQYTLLISQSDSIISAHDNDIFACEVKYAADDVLLSSLMNEDYIYESTISSLTQEITDNSGSLVTIQRDIDDYESQYRQADADEERELQNFRISTIEFNRLNDVYLAKKQYYDETDKAFSAAKERISTAYFAEDISYKELIKRIQVWRDASSTLESEVEVSSIIRSDIATLKIRQAKAKKNYESTCIAASTLSTLYGAAGANYNYALSLSTLTYIADQYASAASNFTSADIAYQNSLPTGTIQSAGGRQRGGDQTLFTIRSMAQQQVYQTSTQMLKEQVNTETLRTIAGIAQTDAYASMLIQYQNNIDSSMRRINTLKALEEISQKEVERCSANYQRISRKVEDLSGMLSTISTHYISSVAGDIRVRRINSKRDEDYDAGLTKYITDSYTLSSFRSRRESSISSLGGFINESTIKKKQFDDLTADIGRLSKEYEDSKTTLDTHEETVRQIREEMQTDATELFIQSSIIKKSEIELEDYLTGILDSINNQEWSSYEYRQTFCQELSVNYKQQYHSLVLGAVQYASTQNGLNAAFGGAPVAQIPINLNTVELSNAYLTLTNLNTFITSFDTIFTQFNKQSSNIATLSTTVGYEYVYWNNFQQSSIALLSKNTPYVQQLVSTSLGAFESSAQAFTDASGVVYSQIENIAKIKGKLADTYSSFFTPAQIAAQDNTISSFIIAGIEQASTLLGGVI